MEDRTLGDITVLRGNRHVYACKSLELPWRGNERRVSCIPAGTYQMTWRYSTARNRNVWWVEYVPGRTAIQIHAANWPAQLLGCVAPCQRWEDIDGDGHLDGAASVAALRGLEAALDGTRPVLVVHGDGRDVLAGNDVGQ